MRQPALVHTAALLRVCGCCSSREGLMKRKKPQTEENLCCGPDTGRNRPDAKTWRIKGLSLYACGVSCRIRAVRVALPSESAKLAASFGFTPWPCQPDGSPVSRMAGIQRSLSSFVRIDSTRIILFPACLCKKAKGFSNCGLAGNCGGKKAALY